MKVRNSITLTSFLVLIVFTSCTKTPRQVDYIPEGTVSVIRAYNKDMIVKTGDKGKKVTDRILKALNEYGFYNETFDMAMSVLFEDSLQTGVNKHSDMMAYLIPSKEFRNAYKCTSFLLDDSAAFSRYLQKVKSNRYEKLEGTKNCVCYINRNDRFSWVAYNDEVVVYGSSTIHTRGILECVNKIFSHSRRTLARNRDFKAFLKQNDDEGIWISTTELLECYYLWYKDLPTFLTLKSIPESILKGNYIHAYISFGKSTNITFQFTPGSDFKRYWRKNKFIKKSFDPTICNWLPQNTLWFMSYALEPQNVINLFKDTKYYDYSEKELKKLDLSMVDAANSFDGNCAFSLYDISLEKIHAFEFVQEYEYQGGMLLWNHLQKEQKSTFPHMVVALGLKDSKIPTMILDHISQDVCEHMGAGVYCFSKIMGFPAYVVCKGNALLLTTDKMYVDSIVKKQAVPNLAFNYGEKVQQLGAKATNFASYHYINYDVRSYPQTMKDYLAKMNVLPLVESYSSIVKSARMTINDSYSGSIDIEFQDTTQNSLYQMSKLLEIIIP